MLFIRFVKETTRLLKECIGIQEKLLIPALIVTGCLSGCFVSNPPEFWENLFHNRPQGLGASGGLEGRCRRTLCFWYSILQNRGASGDFACVMRRIFVQTEKIGQCCITTDATNGIAGSALHLGTAPHVA